MDKNYFEKAKELDIDIHGIELLLKCQDYFEIRTPIGINNNVFFKLSPELNEKFIAFLNSELQIKKLQFKNL